MVRTGKAASESEKSGNRAACLSVLTNVNQNAYDVELNGAEVRTIDIIGHWSSQKDLMPCVTQSNIKTDGCNNVSIFKPRI